jgi:D-sedoheptulose 7-phosphate isomerase
LIKEFNVDKITQQIYNNFVDARDLINEFLQNQTVWQNIEIAGNVMVNAIQSGKKIITCGNGGSMCDAMHFAEELTGKFRNDRCPIPAIAISDPSYISCVANDYGYDQIFSRFIEGLGQNGDVLLAISTSGNSPNIINAAQAGKKKGLYVVGLTGNSGGKLTLLTDCMINIPYNGYADRIQEMHIKVIHSIIHFIELKLNEEKTK